jgi:hypothetical protein
MNELISVGIPFGKKITVSRRLAIAAAAAVTVIVILDLLMTRQIIPYTNISETIMFILTVFIGYGIGSWILLVYTKQATSALRAKSSFINVMYWTVTVTQFSLLGILLLVIYNNSINCHDYFMFCSSARYLSTTVYATSSILATIIMGIISFKFFTWYKQNKRNFMILFYGLATAALATSLIEDIGTKLFMVQVVEEKTLPGAIPESSFSYKINEKYHAEIEYKVVNPHATTIWIVPTSILNLDNSLNYITVFPWIFTWLAVATLLRQYYQSVTIGRLPLKFWIILSIPLILYLVGSCLIFSLPADIHYRFYFRLLFRAGTIGSSVLFGLAFFIITKNKNNLRRDVTTTSGKIKDYLTISAIGIIPLGISLSTSALQQTYGIAAHSLILLACYLFSIGLYSSAIAVSQNSSLRNSVRKSMIDLVDNIGTAQMEQEVQKRIMKIVREHEQRMKDETGISSSIQEADFKVYLEEVMEEVKKSNRKKEQ